MDGCSCFSVEFMIRGYHGCKYIATEQPDTRRGTRVHVSKSSYLYYELLMLAPSKVSLHTILTMSVLRSSYTVQFFGHQNLHLSKVMIECLGKEGGVV